MVKIVFFPSYKLVAALALCFRLLPNVVAFSVKAGDAGIEVVCAINTDEFARWLAFHSGWQ